MPVVLDEPQRKDLRIELRTRNNILWHVIFDKSETVAAFCRLHKLRQTEVGKLLNLSKSPYRWPCCPTSMAQRLADIACMLVEDLFPTDLYSQRIPRRLTVEIPSRAYRSLKAVQHLMLPPTQDDSIMQQELRMALDVAMAKMLTPQQQRIMRLSLSDDEPSESEIAIRLGVTRGCVNQAKKLALHRLRRSGRLRPFI